MQRGPSFGHSLQSKSCQDWTGVQQRRLSCVFDFGQCVGLEQLLLGPEDTSNLAAWEWCLAFAMLCGEHPVSLNSEVIDPAQACTVDPENFTRCIDKYPCALPAGI